MLVSRIVKVVFLTGSLIVMDGDGRAIGITSELRT